MQMRICPQPLRRGGRREPSRRCASSPTDENLQWSLTPMVCEQVWCAADDETFQEHVLPRQKEKKNPPGLQLYAANAIIQTCTLEATLTFLHANIFQSSEDKSRAWKKTYSICGRCLAGTLCSLLGYTLWQMLQDSIKLDWSLSNLTWPTKTKFKVKKSFCSLAALQSLIESNSLLIQTCLNLVSPQ